MEIVLHLGVHKTATTYLQSLLAKNLVPLERHSIGYAYPKTLRPLFARAPRQKHGFQRAMRNSARAWALRQVIDTAQDLQRKRLIISEEQLLGSVRALFSGRGLYRNVAKELRGVVSALQEQPVKVLMAIRKYDTFYASAYGQVLTGWKYLPFDQELRTALLQDQRGWPDIIAELMQTLPAGSTLRLWQYERFGLEEQEILQEFVGASAQNELLALRERLGTGPSQPGIEALDTLVAKGTVPDVEGIKRILRSYGKVKGYPGFSPWSPTEQQTLEDRYTRDIALIRNLWPQAFISQAPAQRSDSSVPLESTQPARNPGQALRPQSNLQRNLNYRRPVTDLF